MLNSVRKASDRRHVYAPTRSERTASATTGTHGRSSAAAGCAVAVDTVAGSRAARQRLAARCATGCVRMIASTIRSSERSDSTDLADDLATRHDDDPIADPSEFDGVGGANEYRHPITRSRPQHLVDLEPAPDVDALCRLLRQQDVNIAKDRPGQHDLLLIATGQEADGLLDRRRTDIELSYDVGGGASLVPTVHEAEAGKPSQDPEGGVGTHSEDGEQRLANTFAAEQHDPASECRGRRPGPDLDAIHPDRSR